jgi:hypothetical protein
LAAAGVKVRQGQPRGVADHAAGAAGLFHDIARQLGGEDIAFLGLTMRDLITFAEQIEDRAMDVRSDENTSVKVIFSVSLHPKADSIREMLE